MVVDAHTYINVNTRIDSYIQKKKKSYFFLIRLDHIYYCQITLIRSFKEEEERGSRLLKDCLLSMYNNNNNN